MSSRTASPLNSHSRIRSGTSRNSDKSALTGPDSAVSRYSARRSQSARWSFRTGLLSSKCCWRTFGRRGISSPNSPKPAFARNTATSGRCTSPGVSTVTWQARRQPAFNSSAESFSRSRLVNRELTPETLTLHFKHVPCPPQGESRGIPASIRATRRFAPTFSFNSLSTGSARTLTLIYYCPLITM